MEKGRRVMEKEPRRRLKEEKESKSKAVKITIITVIALFAIFTIAMILNNFIILDNNETTNLIINNTNVTANLKNDILIENDIIYLSESDIANFFDKHIYYDEDTNKIITTYDEKIAEIGFDNNIININGNNKQISASAINKDDEVYLPISEMQEIYDVEIQNIPETKVITMDSLDREQKRAKVNKNVSVKSSSNFIARTVDRLNKGDAVIVVSSKDGYSRIRTGNGKLGIVRTSVLENETVVREEKQEEKQIEGKVNLVWDYYSEYVTAPNRSGTTIDGINVVSPAFFYIDEEGDLEENIGAEGQNYINWAHNNGYKVWPMVANAYAARESLDITSNIMNSYENRKELIEDIVEKCEEYDLDGINLDFENMYAEDKDMYSRFIIELTPRLKEKGKVLSVDVTAPDGGETWSMCFDRHTIGDVADYIIFMAYDQNGTSSTKPGTTAGYNWVKLNLVKFLQTEEIEPEKLILAVPFYTRVWTTNSSGELVGTPTTIAMKDIDSNIPEGVEKTWNDELKQNYVEYANGQNKRQIWIEDIDSLKAKISLITENNLAGVAAWEKDMETEDVWQMFKEELNK